jgi:hypothetical protein
MKINFIWVLLVLVFGVSRVDAQDRVESSATKDQIKRILASGDSLSMSFSEKMLKIVEVGPDALGSVVELVKEGEFASPLFEALGFLCKPTDKDAVELLQKFALSKERMFRGVAINALMRIGGAPAHRVFDELGSANDFEFQMEVIEHSWLLRDLGDLVYAETAVKKLSQNHPDWKIIPFIRESALPRLERVIGIWKAKNDPRAHAQLFQILKKEDRSFVSVSGGLEGIWAMDRMVEFKVPGAVEQIRGYLEAMQKKGVIFAPHFKKAALQSIKQLGGKLTESEITWLEQDRELSRPLILFRSAEEIRDYIKSERSEQNEKGKENPRGHINE